MPRYKHSAVDRNRLKRRLREIGRRAILPELPPLDLVIRARPEAYEAGFAELDDELRRARAKMLATTDARGR